MKKFLGFCLGIVISIGLSPPAVSASTSSDLQVNISEVIALSITSTCDNTAIAGNDVSLSLTPNSSGVLSSCPNVVTVSTNTPGFQLSLKSNSPNLVNTTNSSYTIASTTNTTANSLLANSWGYALPASSTTNHDIVGIPASLLTNFNNSYLARSNTTPLPNDKYLKPPTTDTTIKDLTSSLGLTTNLVNNQTTIYYAVTADMLTKAGAYSTMLTYTAIGEEVPEPVYYAKIIDGGNFQDTTLNPNESCAGLPVYPATGSTVTMTDTRNNQQYQVRRLQDGKCWMIDNLKLELTNGQILESTTTDVVNITEVWFTQDGTQSGTALSGLSGNFTTSGYLALSNTSSSTASNQDAWRQVNPSNEYYCNGLDPDGWNGDKVGDFGSLTGCGYLYNFYTATAGTAPETQLLAEAPGSLCPANWKLPSGFTGTAGESGSVYGDFGNLDVAYPPGVGEGHNLDLDIQGLWLPAGVFRSDFSGIWYDGYQLISSNLLGDFSILWSRSIYDYYGINLVISGDQVIFGGSGLPRMTGSAIRCLVK